LDQDQGARAVIPQSALYEPGSALRLFKVRRHIPEVLTVFRARTDDTDAADALPVADRSDDDDEAGQSADEPQASRIERHTRDFILEVKSSARNPRDFEKHSADRLRAINYQAPVTQCSHDGGIDVIAHNDPLGIEPPLIKAQGSV
jgi:restriction system protein